MAELYNYMGQVYDIIDNMKDFRQDNFMEDEESEEMLPGIEECERILTEYLERLGSAPDEDMAFEEVQWLIEELSDLNEQYDYNLIRTSEKEDIYELILDTLAEIDIDIDDDMTGEWRDW